MSKYVVIPLIWIDSLRGFNKKATETIIQIFSHLPFTATQKLFFVVHINKNMFFSEKTPVLI